MFQKSVPSLGPNHLYAREVQRPNACFVSMNCINKIVSLFGVAKNDFRCFGVWYKQKVRLFQPGLD